MLRYEQLFLPKTLEFAGGIPDSLSCLTDNFVASFNGLPLKKIIKKILTDERFKISRAFMRKLNADISFKLLQKKLPYLLDYKVSFEDTYELGLLALMEVKSMSFCYAGLTAKKEKLYPVKAFFQKRYFELKAKNPKMRANAITRTIIGELNIRFPNSGLTKTNMSNCLNNWCSKIKKHGSII